MALTVFGAQSANNDIELYGSDGSTGRTTLIKAINLSGSGNVGNSRSGGGNLPFAVIGNFAYFSATDGSTGQELWRTDGTTAGTTKVTEFSTNSGTPSDASDDVSGYNPSNIVAANGYIFFVGSGPAAVNPSTSAARYGIWRYDPGTGTTTFISDDGPSDMISTGSRIYWTEDAGEGGIVRSSDGVAAVTTHFDGGFSSPPSSLYNAGGTVYVSIGGGGGVVKKLVGATTTDLTGAPASPAGFIATSSHVYIIGSNNTLYTTTTATSTATQITFTGLTFDFTFSGAGFHQPGFAALGNKLIFSNNKTVNSGVGAATGSEVWITDGTGAGTVVLKDIVAGSGSSNPHNFITVGSNVFFQATNGNGSVELWKTDGTGAGTVLVDTLFAGGVSSGTGQVITTLNIDNMNVINGVLYFTFDDGIHGQEMWRSDGTAAGTLMVKDINTDFFDSGYSTNFPGAGVSFGNSGVFVGWNAANGYELWTTKGTVATTSLLFDIAPGGGNSIPSQFTLSGGKAYFTAYNPTTGTELWVTDKTDRTYLVEDINPGIVSSNAGGMFAIGNGAVVFSASDGVNGHELWISNGTAAGTYMIKDINTGSSGGFPRDSSPGGFVITANGRLFFTATTSANGRELWTSDGTSAGTVMTKDIAAGAADVPIYSNMVTLGEKVFFQAAESGATTKGSELWVSDGTNAGTFMVKDLNTTSNGTGGTDGSNPSDFVVANNLVFFRAGGLSPFSGAEAYVTDGTNPGTVAISATLTNFSQFANTGSRVFWTAQGASGQELYVSSGGFATVIDIVAGASGSNASNPVAFGSKVLFTASNSASNGQELWISDGTLATTTMLKNINTNPSGSSNPQYITVVGNKAYFVADDGSNGQELWVTDGTTAGTVLVKNIGPGSTTGQVSPLRAADNGHLLFLANDGVSGGQELWITDGTDAGTFKVTNVFQAGGGFYSGFGTTLNGGGAPSGGFTSVPGVTLGSGGENFVGTSDDDFFTGLGGIDTLNGGGGNDVLNGGAANDAIDGGTGFDIAVFSGSSGSYTWTINGPQTTVVGPDGTDTLIRVERMQFSNGTFTFGNTGYGDPVLLTGSFGASGGAGGWGSQTTYPRMMADIDGDDRADIVGFGDSGVSASLGNGSGGFGSVYLASSGFGAGASAGGWSNNTTYPRMFGDVDGNGRDDIVGFGDGGVYIALATSGGNFASPVFAYQGFGSGPSGGSWTSQELYPRTLADVNGDGRADIVGFGDGGVTVALAVGGGNFAPPILGVAWFGAGTAAGGWNSFNTFPRTLADMNNDGRADVVGFGSTGVQIAFARADGTFASPFLAFAGFGSDPSAGGWTDSFLFPRAVGDVNADGNMDLVGFGDAGIYVAFGDGEGAFTDAGGVVVDWFGTSAAAGGWSNTNFYPRMIADINGDGAADFIGFGENGVQSTLSDSDWVLI